jgi:hypothetical protein
MMSLLGRLRPGLSNTSCGSLNLVMLPDQMRLNVGPSKVCNVNMSAVNMEPPSDLSLFFPP